MFGNYLQIRRQNSTNWVTLGSIISELKEGIKKDTGHLDNGHSTGASHDNSHGTFAFLSNPNRLLVCLFVRSCSLERSFSPVI